MADVSQAASQQPDQENNETDESGGNFLSSFTENGIKGFLPVIILVLVAILTIGIILTARSMLHKDDEDEDEEEEYCEEYDGEYREEYDEVSYDGEEMYAESVRRFSEQDDREEEDTSDQDLQDAMIKLGELQKEIEEIKKNKKR